jgi:alanyl aminopeptidase
VIDYRAPIDGLGIDAGNTPAPWKISIATPKDWVALSNADVPLLAPRDVVWFAGPYELIDGPPVGEARRPFRIAVPRGRAADARPILELVPMLIAQLERELGSPFPHEKLDLVLSPHDTRTRPNLIALPEPLALPHPDERTPAGSVRLTKNAVRALARAWLPDHGVMTNAIVAWLTTSITDRVHPGWRVLDAARGARDDAALLDMLEAVLGHDAVRAFAAADVRGAPPDELVAPLGDDGRAMLLDFLEPTAPVVDVELRCAENARPELTLTQHRLGVTVEALWRAPVCVRYAAAGTEHRQCTPLAERTATMTLDAATRCPTWVLANDGARRAYVVAYRGDLLARLLDAWRSLAPVERARTLDDLGELAAAGALDAADALAVLPRVAADPDRLVLDGAAAILEAVRPDVLPDDDRDALRRLVRKLWGARAAALGFHPKPGEDDETRRLRARLLGFVGVLGEDPHLLAEARAVALRWLDDRRAVDPELAGIALALAARADDHDLFDRVVAALHAAHDAAARAPLLEALSWFRHAPASALARDLDPHDATDLLAGLLAAPETREVAFAAVQASWDRLTDPDLILTALARSCDPSRRDELVTFLASHAPKLSPAVLWQVDQCIAQRARQAASVSAFLRRY